MNRKYFVAALYVFISIVPAFAKKTKIDSLISENAIKINTTLAGGHENNIFKSTNRYFDRTIAGYLPKDSLIKSDQFYDANLDIDYVLDLKKSTAVFSLDNWYRGYLANENLNQLKSRFKSEYSYNLTKKTTAGILYQGTYSNKIAVSTTGDELTRSFKYFDNAGSLFMEHDFNRKNQLYLKYTLAYKKYLKEQLAYSLTHSENEISLLYKRRINKHFLYSSLSRVNRKYTEYLAFDKNGIQQIQNPLRNFKYTDLGFRFRYYLNNSISVIPTLDFTIRKDAFEDYYSNKKIAIGSSIKYSYKKLKTTAGIDYKRTRYKIKNAPSATNSNRLKFRDFSTDLDVSYTVNKKLDAFMNFELVSRNSNTELEYYKTLRPYNWYEIMAGIKYNIFK